MRFIDRSPFIAHGLNPEDYDLVVREITALPAAFFDTWSEKNFNVDAPGSTSANLKTLGHRVCQRPMYPLDADVDFRPRAELYR